MSPRVLQPADVREGDVLLCYSDQMVKEEDPYGTGLAGVPRFARVTACGDSGISRPRVELQVSRLYLGTG